jgi:hypothetical protein
MFKSAGCGNSQRTGSETDLVNHDITTEEALTELVDGIQKPRPHQRPVLRIDPQQDQARYSLAPTKDKLAEILVSREKETPFPRRQRDDLHVAEASGEFSDIEHVVTSAAQLSNQRDCDGLVR